MFNTACPTGAGAALKYNLVAAPPELHDSAMPSPAKWFPHGAPSSRCPLPSQTLTGASLVVEARSHIAVPAAKDTGTEFGVHFGDTGLK